MTETISYDLFLHGEWVKPGSLLKIKNEWGTYTYFHVLSYGADIKDTWIACKDSRGNKLLFRPGQIKRVVYKRSYNKCQT